MQPRNNTTTFYVCQGFTCQAPVTNEEDLSRLLK
jgi:uncharacterized protein YyaL (SSP411 family)